MTGYANTGSTSSFGVYINTEYVVQKDDTIAISFDNMQTSQNTTLFLYGSRSGGFGNMTAMCTSDTQHSGQLNCYFGCRGRSGQLNNDFFVGDTGHKVMSNASPVKVDGKDWEYNAGSTLNMINQPLYLFGCNRDGGSMGFNYGGGIHFFCIYNQNEIKMLLKPEINGHAGMRDLITNKFYSGAINSSYFKYSEV